MLLRQLEWQASVLRFIQLRFGGGGDGAPLEDVNAAFFAWLEQTRKNKTIHIQEARLQ